MPRLKLVIFHSILSASHTFSHLLPHHPSTPTISPTPSNHILFPFPSFTSYSPLLLLPFSFSLPTTSSSFIFSLSHYPYISRVTAVYFSFSLCNDVIEIRSIKKKIYFVLYWYLSHFCHCQGLSRVVSHV